jgi:hypothetical protein
MRKQSTDPKADQSKLKINPLYNTSSIIKAVGDKLEKALGGGKKKR